MKRPNPKKEVLKKYKYIFDFQKEIIIEKLYGDVRIEDILEMLHNVFSDKKYSDNFNVIVDICDTKPIFQTSEIKKIIEFLIKNKKRLTNNKVAFITNKPRHVVDNVISHELAIGLGLHIKYKPFSTYDGAYRWFSVNEA